MKKRCVETVLILTCAAALIVTLEGRNVDVGLLIAALLVIAPLVWLDTAER